MTVTEADVTRTARHPVVGRWVVGHDGSPGSRRAIEWAVAHAADRATELRLVSAWQLPVTPAVPAAGPMLLAEECDAIRDATTREVEDAAAAIRARVAVPVESVIGQGGASSLLIDEAKEASLLIVGSRGRGGFGRLLLGSTSTQCAVHSEVPTAVIPDEDVTVAEGRLLVGVDCSPNSREALAWAVEFASPGSTVRVVWVWDASPLAVGADEFFFPDASDLAVARFDELVAASERRAAERGVFVEKEFLRGSPRRDLAARAKDSSLVVLGARGHGAVGAALLGSVSTWMLHHSHRPTVVVPG